MIELGDDGRIRNLSINNNRAGHQVIPEAPHSFLAVRAAGEGGVYLRRLQTGYDAGDSDVLLPPGGLDYRADFPEANFRVKDPGAPVDLTFGMYAPAIPYDYDASALPAIFVAIQITNVTDSPVEVTALLNWQNTCGHWGAEPPAAWHPIERKVLISEAAWERAKGGGERDNELRLNAETGQTSRGGGRVFQKGDIAPNALVFGNLDDLNHNEDGQYCVLTPWSPDGRVSQMVWDPESPPSAEGFWQQLREAGTFAPGEPDQGEPRCGALASTVVLAPGERRAVEFVVSWYAPHVMFGDDSHGNYYENRCDSAPAAAMIALHHGPTYRAAVAAFRRRIGGTGGSSALLRQAIGSSGALAANALHQRDGAFGVMQSPSDPRVNGVRERWFTSIPLLLFYPRLENETLERLAAGAIGEGGAGLIASEGMGRLGEPEYAQVGAAQLDAGAGLVICAYRNFLLSGNLSVITRLAPHINRIMAHLLTQDRDLDGFPDVQQEGLALDGPFATGLNVISAGLWLVALHACEALIALRRLKAGPIFALVRERAQKHFAEYFWNEEHGFYTLYPKSSDGNTPEHPLQQACHGGQLLPVWMADLLGLPSPIPERHVGRVLDVLSAHHVRPADFQAVTWPCGGGGAALDGGAGIRMAAAMPYCCVRLHRAPTTGVYAEVLPLLRGWPGGRYHASQMALWYTLLAPSAVQLRLAEKRLVLRPGGQHVGGPVEHALLTPRGFGRVTLRASAKGAFNCAVDFTMDVPVEITSIFIYLREDPGPVDGRFKLPEGTAPLRVVTEAAPGDGVVVQVYPGGMTSTASFALHLASAPSP